MPFELSCCQLFADRQPLSCQASHTYRDDDELYNRRAPTSSSTSYSNQTSSSRGMSYIPGSNFRVQPIATLPGKALSSHVANNGLSFSPGISATQTVDVLSSDSDSDLVPFPLTKSSKPEGSHTVVSDLLGTKRSHEPAGITSGTSLQSTASRTFGKSKSVHGASSSPPQSKRAKSGLPDRLAMDEDSGSDQDDWLFSAGPATSGNATLTVHHGSSDEDGPLDSGSAEGPATQPKKRQRLSAEERQRRKEVRTWKCICFYCVWMTFGCMFFLSPLRYILWSLKSCRQRFGSLAVYSFLFFWGGGGCIPYELYFF